VRRVNTNKARGTRAESAIVAALQACGWPDADRLTLSGKHDRGDVTLGRAGGQRVVIEVKDHKRLDLAGWVDEAGAEATNVNAEVAVVVHKRRGKGDPADWYATLTVAELLWLLRKAGY
jgi:Holliday junction resolvase